MAPSLPVLLLAITARHPSRVEGWGICPQPQDPEGRDHTVPAVTMRRRRGRRGLKGRSMTREATPLPGPYPGRHGGCGAAPGSWKPPHPVSPHQGQEDSHAAWLPQPRLTWAPPMDFPEASNPEVQLCPAKHRGHHPRHRGSLRLQCGHQSPDSEQPCFSFPGQGPGH